MGLPAPPALRARQLHHSAAYVRGISTRRVEGLVEAVGVTSLSRSQVSELARDLDQTVSEFRKAASRCGPLHVCVG